MELTFEEFWKICQEKLKAGNVIPNWSVSGNIRIREFKIIEIAENSIGYDSPTAKNIQSVSKNEFQQIFTVWESYKKGDIPRSELRKKNQKTTYIIATIKYVEDLIKNNFIQIKPRKKNLVCLMLFVFGAIIFAEKNELWNGFYEEMTPSQVSARVKEVLRPTKVNDVIKGVSIGRDDFDYNEGDIDRPYTRFIEVKTNLEEYMQKTYYDMPPSYQIRFCFYENKLFHIQVLYNLCGNDVVEQLQKKYGECIQKIKHSFEDMFGLHTYCYEYVFKSANSETFVRYLNYNEQLLGDHYFVHYYNPKYKAEYDKQMSEKKEKERLYELERIKRIQEKAVF